MAFSNSLLRTFLLGRRAFFVPAHFLVTVLVACPVCASPAASQKLLAVSWEGFTYEIDPATGNADQLNRPERMFNAMARNRAGTFFASDNSNWLHTIDPVDGSAQFVNGLSGFGLDETIRGMAFMPDDRLFAVLGTPFKLIDRFYQIDLSTAQATLIGDTGLLGLQSLAISTSGVVYSFNIDGNSRGLVTIDPFTGVASDVNPLIGDSNSAVQSLAFAHDGTLYAMGQGAIYTVDTADGSLHRLVDFSIDIRGMEFLPVPEPTSSYFVLCALGLRCGRRRAVGG